MIHLPQLITDLAIILAAAGAVTLLFKKIGQPVVLGYLLAGVLVGPEVSFLPTVQEKDDIKIWAEIGVIVLLFGLGLEFSFKKLAAVGRGASITAVTEIISMLGVGYLMGQAFGWNTMDSIFLGGILSISSTTIILRAFDELGLRQRKFVSLVFGVLIVEDLIAILLMVLLSTIAVSNTFAGMQLVKETGRLGFFLTLWFIGGIFLVPWFLRNVRHLMNEETSMVVALGLCLLMVVLATQLGFSPALGAFIMGSIFAETPDGERIEHNLKPIRDLFAAVFFVSIGMLIEIQTLHEHWFTVLATSLVTIAAKVVSTTTGAIISGQSLKHSVQAGMSLAQIGEFSFIIATLGLTLNVTSDFLYPIAVAVSAITTFTTPYLIRHTDWVNGMIDKALSPEWRLRLERGDSDERPSPQNSDFMTSSLRLFVNGVIVIAIALASSRWLNPLLKSKIGENSLAQYLSLGSAIFLSLPFLWAIASRPTGWRYGPYTQGELRQFTTKAVLSLLGRLLLSTALLGFVVGEFTSAITSFVVIGALSIVVSILGFKNFTRLYQWLENRFLSHLNEKELEKLKNERTQPIVVPWDAHLSEIEVHPDSQAVGQTLARLSLREKFGVTVALIERGSSRILAPGRDAILMPHDLAFVIGNDEQLTAVSKLLQKDEARSYERDAEYGLSHLVLSSDSPFVGKTIRESGLREATDGLIVGIERQAERILNPDALLKLMAQDRLWIVGNQKLIREIK